MDTTALLTCSITQISDIVEDYFTRTQQSSLYEREAHLHTVLAHIGRVLLANALAQRVTRPIAPEHPCPCGGTQRYQSRPHDRHLHTSVGRITVPARPRFQCERCQQRCWPVDEELALLPHQQMSEYLQEHCAYLAASLPYAQVADVLAHFAWPMVVPSQVWHAVQRVGAGRPPGVYRRDPSGASRDCGDRAAVCGGGWRDVLYP